MKPEIGKRYRCKNGQLARIDRQENGWACGYILSDKGTLTNPADKNQHGTMWDVVGKNVSDSDHDLKESE